MKVKILLLFFVFYPSLSILYTIFWVITFFQEFGIIFFFFFKFSLFSHV